MVILQNGRSFYKMTYFTPVQQHIFRFCANILHAIAKTPMKIASNAHNFAQPLKLYIQIMLPLNGITFIIFC